MGPMGPTQAAGLRAYAVILTNGYGRRHPKHSRNDDSVLFRLTFHSPTLCTDHICRSTLTGDPRSRASISSLLERNTQHTYALAP